MEKSEISVAFCHRLCVLRTCFGFKLLRWRFEQPCCGSVVAHPTLHSMYILNCCCFFSFASIRIIYFLLLLRVVYDCVALSTTKGKQLNVQLSRSRITRCHRVMCELMLLRYAKYVMDISHTIYCPQTAN